MKNLLKIPRNFNAKFCWQKVNGRPDILSESLDKNTPPQKKKSNAEIQKKGKETHYKTEITKMLESILDGKEEPKDFNKIPASLFLKQSAKTLRILFIDKTGTINFRGNLKAKREIGLADLFPKVSDQQQFVVLDGATYAYGVRRHDKKIGYGKNGTYKAIKGGEKIEFFVSPKEESNMSFVKTENKKEVFSNEHPSYESLNQNINSFGKLENLTINEEKAEKERFITETEEAEKIETEFRELIDFPKDIAPISDSMIKDLALKLDIDFALIKAITDVESRKNGVNSIRFESHVYKKYAHLGKKTATQMATSFGAFQIMGFNYDDAGFNSIEKMINAMKTPEGQIIAFSNFIQNNPKIHIALKNHNWTVFAKLYNGPNYAQNNYDNKIREAYKARVLESGELLK
jgi:hypothetical protein